MTVASDPLEKEIACYLEDRYKSLKIDRISGQPLSLADPCDINLFIAKRLSSTKNQAQAALLKFPMFNFDSADYVINTDSDLIQLSTQ